MPGWSFTSGAGWTLDAPGGERSFLKLPETLGDGQELDLTIEGPEREVSVCVRSSDYGDTQVQVLIDDTNVTIQTIELDGSPNVLDGPTAHSLPLGTPPPYATYSVQVRIVEGNVEVRFNHESGAAVATADISAFYPNLDGCGFSCATDEARVFSAQVCDLVPNNVDRALILWWVCGGRFYYSLGSGYAEAPGGSVLSPTKLVSSATVLQKVYLTDGSNMRVFDPALLTVSLYEVTAGAPGWYTGPGLVEVNELFEYLGRLGVVTGTDIWMSAVDDAGDMDNGSSIVGQAIVVAPTQGTSTIRENIVSVLLTSAARAVVGCVNSFWELVGDPTLGQMETARITPDVGLSGPRAMALLDEGIVLAHTSNGGLYAIPAGGAPVPVSAQVLAQIVETYDFDTDAITPIVQVVRSPASNGSYLFITPETSVGCRHIWMDDDGRAKGGGFWPDRLPIAVGPTASTTYRGRAVIGTRDGRVLVEDDAQKSDDGVAIVSKSALVALVDPEITADTLLWSLEVMQHRDSDGVVLAIYGGETPEVAYSGDGRYLLFTQTITSIRHLLRPMVSAPALVIEVQNATLDQAWTIDAFVATMETRPLTYARRASETVPGHCAPAVPETPDGGDPTFPDGGGDVQDDEPGETIACDVWMGDNADTSVTDRIVEPEEVYAAYSLGIGTLGSGGVDDVQAAAAEKIAFLQAVPVTGSTGDPIIFVQCSDPDFADAGQAYMLLSEFLALTPPIADVDEDAKWELFFACEILGETPTYPA